MPFKLAHSHEDGKQCFTSSTRYSDPGFHEINGKECLIAYLPYTAHWYCFDTITGREIANFSKEFYDSFLKQSRVSTLVLDPNCV